MIPVKFILDDQDITTIPINKRSVNTVFQNYALFPHINVFDNVAYSLKIRKVPKEIIEQKVIKILKTVHLEKHIYKPIQSTFWWATTTSCSCTSNY